MCARSFDGLFGCAWIYWEHETGGANTYARKTETAKTNRKHADPKARRVRAVCHRGGAAVLCTYYRCRRAVWRGICRGGVSGRVWIWRRARHICGLSAVHAGRRGRTVCGRGAHDAGGGDDFFRHTPSVGAVVLSGHGCGVGRGDRGGICLCRRRGVAQSAVICVPRCADGRNGVFL